MAVPAFIAALLLAALHFVSPRLTFLTRVPRSVWLSAAGGVSVAYVFVHLLPELAEHEEVFGREGVAYGSYLVALAGLGVYYGVERLAQQKPSGRSREAAEVEEGDAVFWIHLGAFFLYNLLVGYLLVDRDEPGLGDLALFTFALGVHFIVNDQGLREHHGTVYDRSGRWLLASAPLAGWAVGVATELPDVALSAFFAFLAGGIVLNVLKEELPEERESRFSAFAAGAAVYAAVLLLSG